MVQKDAQSMNDKIEALSIIKEDSSGRGNYSDHGRSSHSSREERRKRHERHRRDESMRELKVEQVIISFDIQGRKWVKLVILALEDYAFIWWTSMMDDIRRGSKSVEEYHEEMETNLLRAQIREREDAIMARFSWFRKVSASISKGRDAIEEEDCL
ncbi:hypothetical protein CR513_32776, partial [Mucuna pruriens]